MPFYEIPLAPSPRRMTIALGSATYNLRFSFTSDSGWFMDIADVNSAPLVCGVPLVTGADLLAQYAYLGISGSLYVTTDGDPTAVPTESNLGLASHLYFEPNA